MASRLTTQPELKAEELLKKSGQAGRFPIDLEVITEFLNIVIVEEKNLGSDLSGMLIRDDNGHAMIVVNKSDHKLRKRFTIAHELGHYHLHSGRPLLLEANSPKFKLNERRTGGEVPSPHEETQANQFAAELLMPKLAVERVFDQISSASDDEHSLITQLAGEFDVSFSAMQFRLANLGLVIVPADPIKELV